MRKCRVTWKLAEAKNQLTEAVTPALSEGPRTIARLDDTVIAPPGTSNVASRGGQSTLGFTGRRLDPDARSVKVRALEARGITLGAMTAWRRDSIVNG
jgi:hypothetical protein